MSATTAFQERIYNALYGWMEDAEFVSGGGLGHLLGENEDGFVLVPSRTRSDWWDRTFDERNPLHWRFWLASRLSCQIVWLTNEENE